MTFTLQPRLLIYLILGFILATIVGTVTHELGHIAVAKKLGYETELHYGFMNYLSNAKTNEFRAFKEEHRSLLKSGKNSPEKEKFEAMSKKLKAESSLVTLGGPLQTMVTGTLGFLMIWFNRKSIKARLTFLQWTFIFLAFFWSRQIFNFLTWSINYLLDGKPSMRSDEPRISYGFHWPIWSFGLITAIIAAILVGYITFFLIPKQQRFTFITAGIIGCCIGFILWMGVLGPAILP